MGIDYWEMDDHKVRTCRSSSSPNHWAARFIGRYAFLITDSRTFNPCELDPGCFRLADDELWEYVFILIELEFRTRSPSGPSPIHRIILQISARKLPLRKNCTAPSLSFGKQHIIWQYCFLLHLSSILYLCSLSFTILAFFFCLCYATNSLYRKTCMGLNRLRRDWR